jgi:tetratricopeptide (TPR) repeat protein
MSEERLNDLLQQVTGTLSGEVCEQLYTRAKQVRGGAIVEIGAFQGRATVALALGALDGNAAPVYAVDPHERFTGIMGGQFGPFDRWRFVQNLLPERLVEQVRVLNQEAYAVAMGWRQRVGLLLLDADYRHWALRRDALSWMRFVPVGGLLMLGGGGNPKTGTLAVTRELTQRFGFAALERLGPLVVLERKRMVALPQPDAAPWQWPFPNQVAQAQRLFDQAAREQQAGDHQAAEALYEQLLVLNPLHAAALNNYGVLLKQSGRLPEAENLQRAAVAVSPGNAGHNHNLARTLMAAEEPRRALPFLHNAAALAPRHVGLWLELSECWRELKRYDEAEAALAQAAELEQESFRLLTSRALLRAAQNRAAEAREIYEDVCKRWPDNLNARLNLAAHLRQNGYLDEARELYNQVITAKPDLIGAYTSAADLKKFIPGHPWFARMTAWRDDVAIPARQRCSLEFALAEMYVSVKDYDQAFEAYRRGNVLRNEIAEARGHRYDPQHSRASAARTIETFAPEWFAWVQEQDLFGSDSDVPVFVFGMPRSGTTLTESLIAKHPEGGGAGEMEEVSQLIDEYNRAVGLFEGRAFPQNLRLMTKPLAKRLADKYLAQMRALSTRPDARRIVDKMPGNYQWLGFLWLLFPNAAFVDARRDPADNCLSCFMQNFAQRHEYTNRLDHLALQYNRYLSVIEHYHAVFPKPILRWQYEDVVANQQEMAKRLLEFIGLSWDAEVLDFYKDKRTVRTASVLQVRKPIYTSSSGKWRRYERHLKPLLDGLGYVDGEYVGPSAAVAPAEAEAPIALSELLSANQDEPHAARPHPGNAQTAAGAPDTPAANANRARA